MGSEVEKLQLRKRLKRARASLPASDRIEASSLIARRLCRSPWFTRARTVCAYSALGDEVDATQILSTALAAGKRLVLPRVEGPGLLSLRRIESLSLLQVGSYGILEPADDAVAALASEVDLFVVPGLGFDRDGRRIGYGQGYYDRMLAGIEPVQQGRSTGRLAERISVVVGLCFDVQIVREVPVGEHDQLMDALVTESGFVAIAER